MTFVVRAANAQALAGPAAAAVREIDPSQPVADVRPLASVVADATAKPRLGAVLGLALGLVALIVSIVGVYGVINHGVAQRVREFAVRMALGARPRSILALVLREGLGVTVAGLAAGLALGPAAGRALGSALYGTGAADWRAYAASAAVLALAAAAACYLPARRASRSDPMAVLRTE
jgi:putative ABC transport system permease protein